MERMKKADVTRVRDELMKKQNGKCPICGHSLLLAKPIDRVLDHNHETGYVRAVLHRGCNGLEGKVRHLLNTWGRANESEQVLINTLKNLGDFWSLHQKPQTDIIHYTHMTGPERMMLANKEALRKATVRRRR